METVPITLLARGLESLQRLGAETSLKDFPSQLAFVPGSATIAALCANGRLRLIPLNGDKERTVAIGAPSTVIRTHLATTRDRVLAGRFCVDPRTGTTLWSAKPKEWWTGAFTMVVTSDARTAFAGCYRVDVATGKQTGYLADTNTQHTGSIVTSALSRDGKLLATGDDSGNVVVTSLKPSRRPAGVGVDLVGTVRAGGNDDEDSATRGVFRSIEALAFGSKWLGVGGEAPEVRLLSPRDLSLVRSIPIAKQAAETRGLVVAPDGVTLVSAAFISKSKTQLQVWNAETGKERLRVSVPGWCTRGGLAVADDGSTIALALASGVYVCELPRA